MTNPLLDDLQATGLCPNLSVTLPTRGVFYPKEMFEPGTDPMDIPVGVLGILAENTYRDPYLFARGRAVPELLRHIVPRIRLPHLLTEIDVEAILIAARIGRNGPSLDLTHTCTNPVRAEDGAPICRNESKLTIDLTEYVRRYTAWTDEQIARFRVPLERIGQIAHLRPITYESAIKLMLKSVQTNQLLSEIADIPVSEMLVDEHIIDNYKTVFVAAMQTDYDALAAAVLRVETQSHVHCRDRDFIREWLRKLPWWLVEPLSQRMVEINTDLQKLSEHRYVCPKCEFENVFHLQMDPQRLFTPAGEGVIRKTSPAAVPNGGKKGRTSAKILRR